MSKPLANNHALEIQQQNNNNARFDTKSQLFIHRYNWLHAMYLAISPYRLRPNTNKNWKISSARSNKIKLKNPIPASLDTQLDKTTKKNPHLYPQVHQEILWFLSHNPSSSNFASTLPSQKIEWLKYFTRPILIPI